MGRLIFRYTARSIPKGFPYDQTALFSLRDYHILDKIRTEKAAFVQRLTILPGLFFKELRIGAAQTHQLVMMPLLDDFPVFQDIDRVDHPDG